MVTYMAPGIGFNYSFLISRIQISGTTNSVSSFAKDLVNTFSGHHESLFYEKSFTESIQIFEQTHLML